MWDFPKIRGTIPRGPHNKDYSILGSILGSPYLGKLPCHLARPLGKLESIFQNAACFLKRSSCSMLVLGGGEGLLGHSCESL